MIFKAGAELEVIFMDFSREKSPNNPSIDSNEKEIAHIAVYGKITEVSVGCGTCRS